MLGYIICLYQNPNLLWWLTYIDSSSGVLNGVNPYMPSVYLEHRAVCKGVYAVYGSNCENIKSLPEAVLWQLPFAPHYKALHPKTPWTGH